MLSRGSVISARGLGKSYVIEHRVQASMAVEAALTFLANPFHRPKRETIWSLKDISFEIEQGDVVGVIGRNGAGKSTLLKLLSRITEPSCGLASIRGRVGSLIEVGTGFQPELTGRENIFLNGAILGMRNREISRRFDEIVNFSGVEQFLDTPVKRYSSGMYVRLAFAVAAHLDTDILFVDEVLSVGDTEFQQKCLGRLGTVAKEGRTILFVSHNLAVLETLCKTGILLDRGRLLTHGDLKQVLSDYHRLARSDLTDTSGGSPCPVRLPSSQRYFRCIDFLDEAGHSTRVVPMATPVGLRLVVDAREVIEYPVIEIKFYALTGQCMMGIRSPNTRQAVRKLDGLAEVLCTVDRLPFAPGDYTFSISLIKSGTTLETVESGIIFMVRDADTFGDGWGACRIAQCVAPSIWKVNRMAQEDALAD